MSESPPVWACADEDAAEALAKRDNLAELEAAWSDFADALRVVYGVMVTRGLPKRLCRDVTLMYASHFMQPRLVQQDACADDDDD